MNLFAKRVKIFPQPIKGKFRNIKNIILIFCLSVYYIAPWLRWNRGENAPNQAFLVDLANRKFYFLSIELWSHELFIAAILLIMAGLGLFLITSAVGRAWCGYACPQTVWVDLFLKIETIVEGDRNSRMKLDSSPYNFAKISKRSLKHGLWLITSVATGGAWVFYFADAPSLLGQLIRGDAAYQAYIAIMILTLTTYIFGGLLREQVCIYMCPWPRIQGAMLDNLSSIVVYDEKRGEPRGKGTDKGDCIDCDLCVAVCPTGVDIRNGQQLGCITCALCIDACNSVMTKIHKPLGLIDYNNNHNISSQISQNKRYFYHHWRFYIYSFLWILGGLAILLYFATRSNLEFSAEHDRNPLFVLTKDGGIRNGYTIKIMNKSSTEIDCILSINEMENAVFIQNGAAKSAFLLRLIADDISQFKIFLYAPAQNLEPINDFNFTLNCANGSQATIAARFIAR